jgi:hypothetical protein
MAVAARVGLCMEPVNLPAHLMLRPVVTPRRGASSDAAGPAPPAGGATAPAPPVGMAGAGARGGGQGVAAAGVVGEEGEDDDPERPGLLVDAFHGGELCWLADAEERLSSITGMQVRARCARAGRFARVVALLPRRRQAGLCGRRGWTWEPLGAAAAQRQGCAPLALRRALTQSRPGSLWTPP